MNSAGEEVIQRNLNVVRTHIDQLGAGLEDALTHIDAGLRDQVRARWQSDHDVTLHRVNVLTGGGGRRDWFQDWDPAAGYHWPRLRAWLLSHRGRSEREIEALDDASDHVLAHLEDPRAGGPPQFRVQGLVLGHVQSGKTAHFTALIAKAADAGYKLVVVLSGIHNSLRRQTQRRLALELGLEDLPGGVGQPEFRERWVTLTTSDQHGDFRAGTWNANVLQGNERVLLVVKKNASVLRRLASWMHGAVPPDLPVLVIDDEADQASINTGGNRPTGVEQEDDPDDGPDLDPSDMDGEWSPEEEVSPSVINGLVRSLLSSFNRVGYVAYTATPFANVLVDPEASDREVGGGLYPGDFIVSLPRQPGYVGAERLFGRAALDHEEGPPEPLDVVRRVPDHEVPYLVPSRREAWEATMTPSLGTAIVDYVLATAAKLRRLGPGISTMLVHTTQLRHEQRQLAERVGDEVRRLRNAWRYGTPEDREELRARWDSDHRPLIVSLDAARDVTFDELTPEVDRLFRHGIDVIALNSLTGDDLAYDEQPERKVIVVGGNRLSRGITLEDLVVSFYVRNTPNYDTLLQMGRWFGYRESYVDLTRLWTSQELYSHFRHLSLVEEDLRDQIAVYERANLTPGDLGPRILAHPVMRVTAANRMGVGREVRTSYAGQLIQTSRFNLADRDWLEANLEATRRFLAGLGHPHPEDPERPDNRPHWREVSWERVTDFLGQFRSYQAASSFDSDTVARYIRQQAEQHGELLSWWVSVRERGSHDARLGTEDLHIDGTGPVDCISRSRLKDDDFSVGVLTSPARSSGTARQGDEEVGLTDEEIDEAREAVRRRQLRLGTALRQQRAPGEGLLLVYPISRHSFAGSNESNRRDLFEDPERGCTVVGLAIAFPPSDSAATRTYVTASRDRDD